MPVWCSRSEIVLNYNIWFRSLRSCGDYLFYWLYAPIRPKKVLCACSRYICCLVRLHGALSLAKGGEYTNSMRCSVVNLITEVNPAMGLFPDTQNCGLRMRLHGALSLAKGGEYTNSMRCSVVNLITEVNPAMGLFPDTQNCGLRMRRECREGFHPQRGSTIPTCITVRAWRTCRDACRDR